jgi:ribonuclease BN (tRNA processing enzyme)
MKRLPIFLSICIFGCQHSNIRTPATDFSNSNTNKTYYNLNGLFFNKPSLKFLNDFDPRKVNINNQTSGKDLAEQLKPFDATIPFNVEQLLNSTHFQLETDFVAAINADADLGHQYTLREILLNSVLTTTDSAGVKRGVAVLISHGHSIAGLAELAKMTAFDSNDKEHYLFDISVYAPQGGWATDEERMQVISEGAQLWGDQLEITRKRYLKDNIKGSGGFAIALNGHRGDIDKSSTAENPTANIDFQKMFGAPEVFKTFLIKRNINRIVVVTEHQVEKPEVLNVLPITMLKSSGKYSASFDAANKDLYDYLIQMREIGVEVIVVSGDQR